MNQRGQRKYDYYDYNIPLVSPEFLNLDCAYSLAGGCFCENYKVGKAVAKIETKLRDVVKDLYNTTGNES